MNMSDLGRDMPLSIGKHVQFQPKFGQTSITDHAQVELRTRYLNLY